LDTKANSAIAVIFLALILLFLLILVVAASRNFNHTPIDTVNPQLTVEPNVIDWGTLTPGQTDVRMVTLYNLGLENTQPLNVTSTCEVGLLLWDSEGAIIENEESRECVFTLTIWDNVPQGPFNFTITITG